MESAKLDTVMDWPYLRNQKELGCFLGYLNVYQKFIQGFSLLAAPLTTLTKKKVDTIAGLISAECRRSFVALKEHFQSAPLLQHFDFSKRQILHVDSLKYALSAVLLQYDNQGQLQPVLFLSKKWSEKESSWQCHDQELGPIVQAFIELRAWLIDTREPVEVFSDHANLKYFTTNQHLSDRQTRWAAFLLSFHFVIKHISGKSNPANPPTRRPDFLPSGEEEDPCRILVLALADGLHLQGSLLDDFDPCLDVGEVVSSDSSLAAAPARTDLPWQDLSFCPPSAQFKSLLASAYQSPDFQSADEDGLEFK
jgi:hypothetical protein